MKHREASATSAITTVAGCGRNEEFFTAGCGTHSHSHSLTHSLTYSLICVTTDDGRRQRYTTELLNACNTY